MMDVSCNFNIKLTILHYSRFKITQMILPEMKYLNLLS